MNFPFIYKNSYCIESVLFVFVVALLLFWYSDGPFDLISLRTQFRLIAIPF